MQQALIRSKIKQVHDSFADVVFKEGLPMRITKSKHLQKWIKHLRELPKEIQYKTPAYDTLRTTLLQDAKKRVAKELDPWERQTKESGCTICSDGWGDAASRPLLNVLGVNAKGANFITSINTEGEQKTAEYIAEQLMQAILKVGPENVVQVSYNDHLKRVYCLSSSCLSLSWVTQQRRAALSASPVVQSDCL
jgi:hypothetical protein